MTPFLDTRPRIDVQSAEYIRLLGYPGGWVLEDRALELAEGARKWFAQHGRPWVFARAASSLRVDAGAVVVEDVSFASGRLRDTLRHADAHGMILVAASAGPELEAEAQRLWQDGRPDEYFFLEVYGSAVVEHLVTMTGARLCAWAEGERLAVLPHYSPGYPDWDIKEQSSLWRLLRQPPLPASPPQDPFGGLPLEVLESGMLRPKKSLLAAFGLTRHVDRVARLRDLVPCENCSYLGCEYRRVPYRRSAARGNPELPAVPNPALDRSANYSVNTKALRRWGRERLSLEHRPDGTVDALFRYEGTTCTNMGRPLEFLYRVTLSPREDGYRILNQTCRAAEGDEGHKLMCRYLTDRDQLMGALAEEAPLAGRPLNDVVTWSRPARSAGCYCDADSRQHKWGLVFETIHYALAKGPSPEPS